jgi:hypothetical protein
LHFPNGLTLVDDGAALVLAETDGYRLSRLELTGANAGTHTVIAENLPGFADNLSAFQDGRFWVAMVGPRSIGLDRAGVAPGWLRRQAWRSMKPAPTTTTWVMAFDSLGNVVADLQKQLPDFAGATGVTQLADKLYLASVGSNGLLEVDLA